MVNGLQLYQQYRGNEQDMALRQEAAAREAEGSGLRNQMLRFQFAQAQDQAARERQRQNMLAQAMQSGNPNALMMADPKLGFQMQQMRSREQMGRERISAQERMMRERMNQQRVPPGYRVKPDGSMEPIPGGPADPVVAEDVATRRRRAEQAMALPDVIAQAEQGAAKIDAMIGDLNVDEKGNLKSGTRKPHPGFEGAVGMSGIQSGFGLAGFIPGTDTTDFKRRLDEIKGGAFMQAFQSLKGGGQITEKEGEKATAAITRMDKSQSEKEFVQAAREFQDTIRSAVERARGRISVPGAGKVTGGGAGGLDMGAIDAELARREGRR